MCNHINPIAISLLSVLVGGMLAVPADALSDDWSDWQKRTEEVNKIVAEANQHRAEMDKIDKMVEDSRKMQSSMRNFKFNNQFDLNDFKECTQISDGYVKYNGRASCVNAYYDAACTNEHVHYSDYTLGYNGNINVCKASALGDPLFWYIMGGIMLVVMVPVACIVFFKKNKNQPGNNFYRV